MASHSYHISSGYGVRNFSSCSAIMPKPGARSCTSAMAYRGGSPGGLGYRRLGGFGSRSLCAVGSPRIAVSCARPLCSGGIFGYRAGGAPCLSSSVPQGPPGALQTRALEREEGAPRLRLLASPLPSPTAPSSSAACPRGAGASCTRLPSRRGPSKAPRCLGPRASRPLGLGGWQLASPDSGRANVQGAGRPSFLRPERVLFCPNPKVEFLNFQRSLSFLLSP